MGDSRSTPTPTVKEKWFYLPVTPLSMAETGGFKFLDLYDVYEEQSQEGLGLDYDPKKLELVILGYDTKAFRKRGPVVFARNDIKLTLVYNPNTEGVTDKSFINLAIKVKE